MRSELVEIDVDDHGKTTTYYTYTGYYSPQDRQKIKDFQRNVQQRSFTAAFLTAMLAYYVSTHPSRPPERPTWPTSAAAPIASANGDSSRESQDFWGATFCSTKSAHNNAQTSNRKSH